MDQVAVVVLNWNGREMLERFMPQVLCHSEAEGVAIYVVDNGSTDDSKEWVTASFPSVRLLTFDENLGFAGGYDRALRQIEAEYVVLLNSDVEVTSGWLSPLIDHLEAHPGVAACQPKIRSWREKELFEYAGAAGGFIDRYGYPFCRGRIRNTLEEDKGQYDTAIPVFWATGAALCIRRTDYLAVGGLDKHFFAHMEEIDLCWRLWSAGRQVCCVPQSTVYHVGGGTLQTDSPHKTFLNFRNNLLMLYKNLSPVEAKKVLRMRFFLDYLAALSFVLQGKWAQARAIRKARRSFQQMKPLYKDKVSAQENSVIPSSVTFRGSILWSYYVKGLKRFSELQF
ncbi:MAG: glycosyltransferase family 2 protein [Bacteroides sp.]|nr:glycosyltransferase family 2 protein [Bacteroides sp.]